MQEVTHSIFTPRDLMNVFITFLNVFKKFLHHFSESLTINKIERMHSWCTTVAYPICLSVCPESVLWQNGLMDSDAVWTLGGEWGRSRDGCIRLGGDRR